MALMLQRLDAMGAGRHPSDATLVERAAALSRRYLDGDTTSVRWADNQGSRWGSHGRRRFDPAVGRLRRMPPWVIDYVLVHELAHLLVPRHGSTLGARRPLSPHRARLGLLRGVAAAAGLPVQDEDDPAYIPTQPTKDSIPPRTRRGPAGCRRTVLRGGTVTVRRVAVASSSAQPPPGVDAHAYRDALLDTYEVVAALELVEPAWRSMRRSGTASVRWPGPEPQSSSCPASPRGTSTRHTRCSGGPRRRSGRRRHRRRSGLAGTADRQAIPRSA